MGRAPCCEKVGLKKGRWTTEEDKILIQYIHANGEGSWRSLPIKAGLLRCGKSCRLRWMNYLKADLKRGNFTAEEDEIIVKLQADHGNRWSLIAGQLPGRTDNEIKNYWNSHLRKFHKYPMPGTHQYEKIDSTSTKRATANHLRRIRSQAISMQKHITREVVLQEIKPDAEMATHPCSSVAGTSDQEINIHMQVDGSSEIMTVSPCHDGGTETLADHCGAAACNGKMEEEMEKHMDDDVDESVVPCEARDQNENHIWKSIMVEDEMMKLSDDMVETNIWGSRGKAVSYGYGIQDEWWSWDYCSIENGFQCYNQIELWDQF